MTRQAIELPYVFIVATTFFPNELRAATFADACASWNKHLKYDGQVGLIISDDGSAVIPLGITSFKDMRPRHTYQFRHGVGASLNAGFKLAFETTPVVLYAVDDWALVEDFDITPWVYALVTRNDIGMVRLGPPHPKTRGSVEAVSVLWQGWALRLDRVAFAFGHRPALYHKRMIDAYGWFEEDVNAYECEQFYNENFCSSTGPDIIQALPHPWQHIESIELADVDPKKG